MNGVHCSSIWKMGTKYIYTVHAFDFKHVVLSIFIWTITWWIYYTIHASLIDIPLGFQTLVHSNKSEQIYTFTYPHTRTYNNKIGDDEAANKFQCRSTPECHKIVYIGYVLQPHAYTSSYAYSRTLNADVYGRYFEANLYKWCLRLSVPHFTQTIYLFIEWRRIINER